MPPDPAPPPTPVDRFVREVTQLPDGRRQTFYSARKPTPVADPADPR